MHIHMWLRAFAASDDTISSNETAVATKKLTKNNSSSLITDWAQLCLYVFIQGDNETLTRFTMHAVELVSFHHSLKTDDLKPWTLCHLLL
jgi:hypothetical protein